jgi:hypothetical protein
MCDDPGFREQTLHQCRGSGPETLKDMFYRAWLGLGDNIGELKIVCDVSSDHRRDVEVPGSEQRYGTIEVCVVTTRGYH